MSNDTNFPRSIIVSFTDQDLAQPEGPSRCDDQRAAPALRSSDLVAAPGRPEPDLNPERARSFEDGGGHSLHARNGSPSVSPGIIIDAASSHSHRQACWRRLWLVLLAPPPLTSAACKSPPIAEVA